MLASRTPTRTKKFLSTLSLRRATPNALLAGVHAPYFYPRSPCGERQQPRLTLMAAIDFYPRSPCGERRQKKLFDRVASGISIHALLAESDPRYFTESVSQYNISIHALLAESDFLAKTRIPQRVISIHALLAESDNTVHG